MHESCDILVVGGGLVGASLAIALDAAGRRVCMVEAVAPRAGGAASYDERNLALARASVNGLDALGVWPYAAAQATSIRQVHISRAGDFAAVRLDAAAHGLDALGHTLPARELGAALQRRLADCRYLQRHAPATLVDVQPCAQGWRARVELADGKHVDIDTQLLVGADGSHSFVRKALGIGVDVCDYAQTLFVATVTPQRPPQGRAFERFSDSGPVALLPLAEGRAGLVLTVPTDQTDAVKALDDEGFLAVAQQR
ncbi:MAG: FAD-dependent monooxygenase, partial [Xanthomonadales bacterium]|nr:FAD-dependent monooxygenase [Xanthomonadales bacterium]